jgi:hypothetical protein
VHGVSELLFIPLASFVQAVHRCALGKLNRRIEVLRHIFLFNRWSFEKLSKFCLGLRRMRVPAGSQLYSQGDPVGPVYFLESGQVLVEYDADKGRSLMEKRPSRAARRAATGAGGANSTSIGAPIVIPPPSAEELAQAAALARSGMKPHTGFNVGAAPGYFSLSGENHMQLQAELQAFRARTRRQRGNKGSTLLKATSSFHSAAVHRSRKDEYEDDDENGAGAGSSGSGGSDGSTDSASEEEDTLVAHAMRALNAGVGLGVRVGSELSQKQRAPSEMLSELSEELAPENKLMAAMQAQILAKRAGSAQGHAEAIRKARAKTAKEHELHALRNKRGFKARPMPAAFSNRLTAAEQEMQQLQQLADAAAERKRLEAQKLEASLAPPLSAADVLARAAIHLPLAASEPEASTESGVADLLKSSKDADNANRQDSLMWKLRHMQKVALAARAERMRLLAEEEAEVREEKRIEEREAREQEQRFRRMIARNSEDVKQRGGNAAANRSLQNTPFAPHTHHSYVLLHPFCTFLGGLTPPSRGPRRPAVQFFKFFLLRPQAFRLHLVLEEASSADTNNTSPLLLNAAATEAYTSGLFVSFGAEGCVPSPASCQWRASLDALASACSNHPSSRLSHGSRRARGNVQHYALEVDPARDDAFRQSTQQMAVGTTATAGATNFAQLKSECWYYLCVQSVYACSFMLKFDLINSMTNAPDAGSADAPPSFVKKVSTNMQNTVISCAMFVFVFVLVFYLSPFFSALRCSPYSTLLPFSHSSLVPLFAESLPSELALKPVRLPGETCWSCELAEPRSSTPVGSMDSSRPNKNPSFSRVESLTSHGASNHDTLKCTKETNATSLVAHLDEDAQRHSEAPME